MQALFVAFLAHVFSLARAPKNSRSSPLSAFLLRLINDLPIRKTLIDTIIIQLADDQGKLINFTSGVVVVDVQGLCDKKNTLKATTDIVNMAFRPAGRPLYPPPYPPATRLWGVDIFRVTAPYQSGQGFWDIFRRRFRPVLQLVSEKASREVIRQQARMWLSMHNMLGIKTKAEPPKNNEKSKRARESNT